MDTLELQRRLRDCKTQSGVDAVAAAIGRTALLAVDAKGRTALDFVRFIRQDPDIVTRVEYHVAVELEKRKFEEANARAGSFVGRFMAANAAAAQKLSEAVVAGEATEVVKALDEIEKSRPPTREEFANVIGDGEDALLRFDRVLARYPHSRHRQSVLASISGGRGAWSQNSPREEERATTATDMKRKFETPLSRARTQTRDMLQRAATSQGSIASRLSSSAEDGQLTFWADVSSSKGMNALAIAAVANNLQLVEQLLRLGASPNAACALSRDAATIAAENGFILPLRAMIVSGKADLGHKQLLNQLRDTDELLAKPVGFLTVNKALPLVAASKAGHVSAAKVLLQAVREEAVATTSGPALHRGSIARQHHWSTRVLHWFHARDSSGETAMQAASSDEMLSLLQSFEKKLMESAHRDAADRTGKQVVRCKQCGVRLRREEMDRHLTYLCAFAPLRDRLPIGVPKHIKLPGLSLGERLLRLKRPQLYHARVTGIKVPEHGTLRSLEVAHAQKGKYGQHHSVKVHYCVSSQLPLLTGAGKPSTASVPDQRSQQGSTGKVEDGRRFTSFELSFGGELARKLSQQQATSFVVSTQGRIEGDGTSTGHVMDERVASIDLAGAKLSASSLVRSSKSMSGQKPPGDPGEQVAASSRRTDDLPSQISAVRQSASCPFGCGMVLDQAQIGEHVQHRCPLRTRLCPDGCGERIEARMALEHSAVCSHRVITCGCGATVRQSTLTTHLATDCPRAEIQCLNACGLTIRRDAMQQHLQMTCRRRVQPCPQGCKELVIACHLDKHLADECKENLVACPYGCSMMLHRGELARHSLHCSEAKTRCPHGCGAIVMQGDQKLHDLDCPALRKGCPLGCGLVLQNSDLDRHMKSSCPRRMVRCRLHCGAAVRLCDTQEHESQDCFNGSVQCSDCGQLLLRRLVESHSAVCDARQLACGHGGARCTRSIRSWLLKRSRGKEPGLHRCIEHGSSPFTQAAVLGDAALLAHMIALVDSAELDLDHGLGKSPLVRAAELGIVPAIHALVDAGADPNAETAKGRWPLGAAAEAGQPLAVRALIDRGAKASKRNRLRRNALQYAAAGSESFEILRCELEQSMLLGQLFRRVALGDASSIARALGGATLQRWTQGMITDVNKRVVNSDISLPPEGPRQQLPEVIRRLPKRAYAAVFHLRDRLEAQAQQRGKLVEKLQRDILRIQCDALRMKLSIIRESNKGFAGKESLKGAALTPTLASAAAGARDEADILSLPPEGPQELCIDATAGSAQPIMRKSLAAPRRSITFLRRQQREIQAKLSAAQDASDEARTVRDTRGVLFRKTECGHSLISFAAAVGDVQCLAVLLRAGGTCGIQPACYEAAASLVQAAWRRHRTAVPRATKQAMPPDAKWKQFQLELARTLSLRRSLIAWKMVLAQQPLPLHQAIFSGNVQAAMLLVHCGFPATLRSYAMPLGAPPQVLDGSGGLTVRVRVPALQADGTLSERDDPTSEFFEEDADAAPVVCKEGTSMLSRGLSIAEIAFAGCRLLGHKSFVDGVGWTSRSAHVDALDACQQILRNRALQMSRFHASRLQVLTLAAKKQARETEGLAMERCALARDTRGIIDCLERGASPGYTLRNGYNAMCMAARYRCTIRDKSSGLKKPAVVYISDRFSASAAAQASHACVLGVGPLHIAAFHGSVQSIRDLLLQCRVPPDHRARAPMRGYGQLAQTEFRTEADQIKGTTALAFACINGQRAAVRELLLAGASVYKVNGAGDSAVQVCERYGSLRCLELVREARRVSGPAAERRLPAILGIEDAAMPSSMRDLGTAVAESKGASKGASHLAVHECSCGATVTRLEAAAHARSCPASEIECSACKQAVMRGNYRKHQLNDCPERLVGCPKGCRAALRAKDVARHVENKQCIK